MRIDGCWILVPLLAACSGGGGTPGSSGSGQIVLSPLGSSSSPIAESCSPFIISASESGYSGSFTISMSGGSNGAGGTDYALPPQTTTNGSWLISNGLLCVGGSKATATQFTVTDQNGNSASTFVTTEI